MEILEYIEEKRDIQSCILQLLENEDYVEENFQNFTNLIHSQSILNDKCEIKVMLRLILNISNNHYRTPNFFEKIERLLLFFKNDIEKNFTNFEIYSIFSSNRRIVLFLVKEKIITIDQTITKVMETDEILYFFPESKPFIDESILTKSFTTIPENFETKREIGENDTYICEIIRKDLIEEFIIYVNKLNYSLKSTIENSIYETNSLLMSKDPTLIEYSAFFGSIQIFKYLYMNNVEISGSVWLYAIHGDNEELIHLLEENDVIPDDPTYDKCYKESIKCHHKGIAYYIQENYVDKIVLKINIATVYNLFQYLKNSYVFHYCNFLFFPNDLNISYILFYLCKYDYLNLLKLYLKSKEVKLNERLILKSIFFCLIE